MKIFFILVLSALCYNSCVINLPVPSRIRKAMVCYDSTYTGIDTLINIHGYYSRPIITDKRGLYGIEDGELVPLGIDTIYISLIFYNDGIYIDNFGFYGVPVSEGLTLMHVNGNTFNRKTHKQGTFRVFGDTIKTQYITNSGIGYYAYEDWYKIIDKNSLQLIYSKHLAIQSGDKNKPDYQPKHYENEIRTNFVYVKKIPKSDSWLKKEDWFWCK